MEENSNAKPIRILYVQPGRGVGGASVSLSSLVRALPQHDFSAQVILQAPVDRSLAQLLNGNVEKVYALPYLPGWNKTQKKGFVKQIKHEFSKLKFGGYLLPTFQIAKIIREEKIDLVHTNSSISPVGALAAWLTRRAHIWHIREPLGSNSTIPLILGDRLAAQLFYWLSRVIICNSSYTAKFFRNFGIGPKVIYNGINLEEFKVSGRRGEILRKKYDIPDHLPVIGMVGSLRSTWKEHNLFILAMSMVKKQIPDARFIIFGGGFNPELSEYVQSLHNFATQLGLSNQVTWADFEENIPAMMGSMDILVHPTSQEGSGRIVMEAMTAGKPVVGVRSGGVQELIQDGETGILVEPGSAEQLAASVIQLLSNPEKSKQFGVNAETYAQKYFSHETMMASIQTVYREVLSV